MNKLQQMKTGWRCRGEEHSYRSDFAIFYTNGRIACGPRVQQPFARCPRGRRRGQNRRPRLKKASFRFSSFMHGHLGIPF